MMLIVVIMGIRLGIETIARAAEIIFPWFIVLFLMLVVFVSPQIDLQKIQPVLEKGIKPVLHGALLFAAYPFMEYVTFLFIIPYVNGPGEVGKAFFAGTCMGGTIIVVSWLSHPGYWSRSYSEIYISKLCSGSKN